ncbi:hypothetical protein [Streptomyces himalayensis]|uniref:Secreted protein n=1 Tax=Streptomyces himalayensis subsp. himalayensis TaxID=2756131 RepID=A0A7W0DVE1_9ACTN|nr:hypothetical protein [Streptomyces himalayensis]MBA2951600.1 hypothetical protein [Streptomyces himalayensis subsp. himalayensis]
MRIRTVAIAAALLLAPLTACSSEAEANPAACKAAMEKQFKDAVEKDIEGKRPSECEGVDNKTLERYVGEIVEDQLKDATSDLTEPSDSVSTPSTEELEQDLEDLEKELDELEKELEETP